MTRRTFRPPWWAVVLVPVLGGAMSVAGVWQLQRAAGKADILAQYAAAAAQTALRDMTAGAYAEPGVIERARAIGTFDGEMQLLLDNQSWQRRPGYRVWTPLRLSSGGIIVVDRGWAPATGDRSRLPAVPTPQGVVTIDGYWRTVPEPGMRLDIDNCAGGLWPRVVQYPTVDELRCLYGEFVAGGLMLMDPDVPGGFVREWNSGPEMSPDKNYAYAAQWFVFTLLLVGLFIKFSFRSP